MKKILLVEDDESLRRGISFALEQENYQVIVNHHIKETLELISNENPDLIILDINLPDGNGLDLCKEIRKITATPIFFLSAADMETDVVCGLSLGADDYITKPFSLAILKAKIASVLRRFNEYSSVIEQPPFTLNLDENRLYKSNKEVFLSSTEYKIVQYLMKNSGIVLEKEKILEVLWGYQGKYVDENTLSVNISRIRVKIEDDPQNPLYIKTIRSVGYVWNK